MKTKKISSCCNNRSTCQKHQSCNKEFNLVQFHSYVKHYFYRYRRPRYMPNNLSSLWSVLVVFSWIFQSWTFQGAAVSLGKEHSCRAKKGVWDWKYSCMHRLGGLGGDVCHKLGLVACVSVLWWWHMSVGAADLCLRRIKLMKPL